MAWQEMVVLYHFRLCRQPLLASLKNSPKFYECRLPAWPVTADVNLPEAERRSKIMKKKLLCVVVVLAFVLMAGTALAQPKRAPAPPNPPAAQTENPVATISIIDVAQAIGVGPIWGQGVITYENKTHLFKVKGFEKLSVGRKKMRVNGDVYRLNQLSDLAGKYRKAEPAGFTFIAHPKGMVIQNDKGVVIDLEGKVHGLQLDIGKEGLTIKDIKI
jgi:hypothetical protein